MEVGIFGSGRVGQTLGGKLASIGNEVMLGTRDPAKLQDWLSMTGSHAHSGSFAETAAFGEILINATKASASLSVLEQAGEANLQGKILIDLANPLEFSPGKLATISVAKDDSIAEQIQRAHPEVKVVKTLNTVGAGVMVDPGHIGNGDHDLFISGNNPEAKAQVTQLLGSWFGWRNFNDLGDISTARAAEMYMVLWNRLREIFQSPLFNVKIVK